jgi:hypothetical protein
VYWLVGGSDTGGRCFMNLEALMNREALMIARPPVLGSS